MKLYYYKDKTGNFGDDLNEWLWDRLLPGCFDDDESTLFVGIGTLLNSLLPKAPFKVVFSSGVGYKSPPAAPDKNWDVLCVRGPLSARELGISPEKAITDGAALLRTLSFPQLPQRFACSFVPHHQSHRPKWAGVCERLGLHYINPAWPVDRVLGDIRQSKLVLAESMHGAIVADIFRVPWIAVSLHQHILDFKWHDWCQSLDLSHRPVPLPAVLRPEIQQKHYIRLKYSLLSAYLLWVAKTRTAKISEEKILERKTGALLDKLAEFKRNYC
jgi:succinoglycan biosynthesis protein ExoV